MKILNFTIGSLLGVLTFLGVGVLATGNTANAQLVGENCPTSQILSGKYMVNTFFTRSWGCLIQITPIDKPDMTYREYIFDEGGRLLVFNSTTGPFETATGMRVFYLFPRKYIPAARVVDKKIEIFMSNGSVAKIPDTSFWIESIQGISFFDDQKIGLDAQGGFEITNYDQVYLDTGWKIGGQAYRDPLGKATFVDSKNQKCEVNNFEIFVYAENESRGPFVKDDSPEPYLLYQSDESLYEFLQLRCPTLKLN